MSSIIPQILVALVAVGMALAFVAADRESPTSRALALALTCIGIAIALNATYFAGGYGGPVLPGWLALPESAAIAAVLEWLLRVRRTIPARELDTAAGDWMLRLGQVSAAVYSGLSLLAPATRAHDFLFAATDASVFSRAGFWLFATPILFASLTGLMAVLLLLNRHPDRPERLRVIGLTLAIPFFMAGFVLPPAAAAVSVLLGELTLLVGGVQYHVLQGQRGQFLSRFLSSQVAELVRDRGLKATMEQNYLEITVVVSDLRGFTAYAQAHPSSRVIQVLRDYYDVVGRVVADYGGTIKDYAGDGILILVGAPLPTAEHAAIGLRIAHRIRGVVAEVTGRWSGGEHRLGLGIGVASGFVTVGVIGSASRLEYTAVGAAVNLASRLCEHALDGEILVDARTRELAAAVPLERRDALAVKGFAEPVPLYALAAGAG